MLNITKKIYPEGGEKRQMLNKLARSIQVDSRAALCFQALEFVLETVAIFHIIGFLAALAGGSMGAVFTYILWGLSALVALSIQEQFAVNVGMSVQVQNDPVFAARLGSHKHSYRNARWAIFFLALSLNTAGGYIIATSKTFKADTSTIAELDRQYNAEKQRINGAYTEAITSAAMYDAQANEVRKTWKEYAKNKPNEKTYAGIQKEKEVKALMDKKQAETADAAQAKKRELEDAKATYESQSAVLKGAAVEDVNKQHKQEWLAFFGSLALSSVLLILVSVMRTRVANNEAKCGIRYEIQMPSNEEQSVLSNALFTGKYIASKLLQTVLYAVYSCAAWFSDRRFNFTGYASTKARNEKLDIQASAAHQNEPEQPAPIKFESPTPQPVFEHAPAPYSPKDVPFEIVYDDNKSELQNATGSVSENSRANRNFVSTQTAQTVDENSANSANENSFWSKQKGESPRRKVVEGGGVTDANTTLDMDGEQYTLRTLKTMRQAYQKRSQDATTRPEARSANHAKWSKINAIILDHENSKQGEAQ
jgi:hypothetical protein